MRFSAVWAALACLMSVACAAQGTDDAYGRKNIWTVFAEYSNDSSHIYLGYARDRKVADFGGAYARRILAGRNSALSYLAELRPFVLEGDPAETLHVSGYPTSSSTGTGSGSTTTSTEPVGPPERLLGHCVASSGSYSEPGQNPGDPPVVISYSYTCGREWTFGQAFSPVGLRYSMMTRHKLQPFLVMTAGYLYANRPVPVDAAGSFNFAFDFGGGVEVFRSKKRSVSLEARVHHFSNKNTADSNPGTDSVRFKASYSFGR